MQKYIIYILAMVGSVALFCSCGDSNGDEPAPPVEEVHRTVLVYMLADNNLGSDYDFDDSDIAEMVNGAKDGGLNGGRLIVYHNRPGTANGNAPQLLEITPEGADVLKTYPDNPDIYSVQESRMRAVLSDMRQLAPAKEYGMVFWGHATAWMTEDGDLPASSSSKAPQLRSYGSDREKWMSFTSLGNVLADEHFEFVYFDCCLMGTAEVVYEFRDVAPVIVASPTEVEGVGMPYHLNIPVFFADGTPDMVQAATNTYEYLRDRYLCSQMVVVKTAALPALATATRNIFSTLSAYPGDYSGVQTLSRSFTSWKDPNYTTFRDTRPVHDMESYMKLIAKDRPDLLAAWQSALDGCVAYKATTPREYTGIPVQTYCGLGTFIIKKPEEATYRGYEKTQWWADVVSAAPIFN